MVFDMTDQDSLDEVEYRWVRQLKRHLSSKDVPVLLVGNKVSILADYFSLLYVVCLEVEFKHCTWHAMLS